MTGSTPDVTTAQIAGVEPPAAPPMDDQVAPSPPARAGAPSDLGDPPGHRATAPEASARSLIGDNGELRERWAEIQTMFVDEPRQAVERADTLVAEVIQQLARVFADERGRLESAWSGGSTVSTEDLRVTLQKYRDFFEVLLRT